MNLRALFAKNALMLDSKSIVRTNVAGFLLVVALYITLSVVYTYPAVLFSPNEAVLLPGAGEVGQFLWNLWYFKYSLVDRNSNPFLCDIAFYPDGVITALSPFHALYGLFSTPFQLLGFTLLQCFTLLALWSYAASGIFMYLLVRYMKRGHLVAFLAGVIYAFSAYRLSRVLYGQINLIATEWVPLYALCLMMLLKKPSVRRGIVLGLAFLAQAYTSYYYSVFLMLFTVVILLVNVRWERRVFARSAYLSRRVGALSVSLLVCALAMSLLPMIQSRAFSPRRLSIAGWILAIVWFLIFWRPAAWKALSLRLIKPILIAIFSDLSFVYAYLCLLVLGA